MNPFSITGEEGPSVTWKAFRGSGGWGWGVSDTEAPPSVGTCTVPALCPGWLQGTVGILGSGKDRRPGFPSPMPPQALCPCLFLLNRSWMTLPRTISIWVSAHSHSSLPRAGPREGSPGTHGMFRWPCSCSDLLYSQALDSIVQRCRKRVRLIGFSAHSWAPLPAPNPSQSAWFCAQ